MLFSLITTVILGGLLVSMHASKYIFLELSLHCKSVKINLTFRKTDLGLVGPGKVPAGIMGQVLAAASGETEAITHANASAEIATNVATFANGLTPGINALAKSPLLHAMDIHGTVKASTVASVAAVNPVPVAAGMEGVDAMANNPFQCPMDINGNYADLSNCIHSFKEIQSPNTILS
ncbi:MAG: hypothetical protein ACR2OB_11835 [Solirubrobacteraceae bacterium]